MTQQVFFTMLQKFRQLAFKKHKNELSHFKRSGIKNFYYIFHEENSQTHQNYYLNGADGFLQHDYSSRDLMNMLRKCMLSQGLELLTMSVIVILSLN